MNQRTKTLITAFLTLLVGSGIFVSQLGAAPLVNILGRYAVVGTGLNATTSVNANFTASGTIAFPSLGSSGCVSLTTGGQITTSTCGGVGISTSSPFSAGYIVLATSSTAITNSALFQKGNFLGIGTTNPQTPLEIQGGALVVGGTASSTIYGDGTMSFFGGGVAVNSSNGLFLNNITGNSSLSYDPLINGIVFTGETSTTTIDFMNSGSNFSAKLDTSAITADRTFTFPNKSGTIAMTSDIRVISTTTITTATTTNLNFTTATGTTLNFADSTKLTTGAKGVGFNVINASTTATATTTIQKQFYQDITITQLDCSTNGASITIRGDERTSSTPDTAGTVIGADMVCDSNGFSTSTFSNATIANLAVLNFSLVSVPNSTTTLRVYFKIKEQ